MKKSVIIAICIVLVIAITVGTIIWIDYNRGYNIVVDENGETHVLATNIDGSLVQDEYGGVFEILEDENGDSYTKPFNLPDRVTNKRGNRIENMFIVLKVPKHWSNFSANDKLSIKHEGTCLDLNKVQCQVDVRWEIMASNEQIYEDYIADVKWLVQAGFGFGELKEYETEICGLKATAASYKNTKEGGTFYYYLVERGLAAFEIEAYACDDCFTEDELKEFIADTYTLKDLGGVRPTTPATEESTEETFEDTTATTTTTTTTTAKSEK